MSGVVHHVLKRGIQATQEQYQNSSDPVIAYKLPTWGIVALWATALVYMAVMFAVRYTYGSVVATLTMIETPTATAVIKVTDADSEDPDAPLLTPDEKAAQNEYIEPELLLVKTKPITSGLRSTIKHLQARAGCLARFRGLHVFLLYHIVHHGVFQLLNAFHFIPRTLAAVLATVLLSRVDLTWTHLVVSEPSTKRWYQRIPARNNFKKIVGPAAVFALAEQATIIMPATLGRVFALEKYVQEPGKFGDLTDNERVTLIIQIFLVCMIGIATTVLILIPARVALRRVEASMLPEEDESIVPFDRTFGGKVVPEILGGSGRVAMLEAWKSFDWNARVRLIKLYAKIFAIQSALSIMFVMVVVGELKLIMGDQLDQMVAYARTGTNENDWVIVPESQLSS